MNLSDAHCHLQDARFDGQLDLALARCREFGIKRWMVNATREADWDAVSGLAANYSEIRCSFGLHPWWQKERGANWQPALERVLQRHPEAGIGETGLDRWMEGFDFADQLEVLHGHLELSKKLDRPVSLHCLRAWPELAGCVKRCPPSKRGFLLHSFNGPEAMVEQWVELGAYFSFSPAFLYPRKAAVRETLKRLPLERILVESDAPDMAPPQDIAVATLPGHPEKALNHPANLILCVDALAADRGITPDTFALQLEANYERLFGK